jgi:hypothetical protein
LDGTEKDLEILAEALQVPKTKAAFSLFEKSEEKSPLKKGFTRRERIDPSRHPSSFTSKDLNPSGKRPGFSHSLFFDPHRMKEPQP